MAADVDLADRLAQRAVEHGEAALPAVALLRHAAQGARVEVEARLVERARQELGVGVDEVEGQPVLPGLQRHLLEQPALGGDRRGLADDDGRDAAQALRLQQSGQLNCGASAISCSRFIGL